MRQEGFMCWVELVPSLESKDWLDYMGKLEKLGNENTNGQLMDEK